MLEEVGGLTVGGWGRRNRLKCLKKGERENGKRGCRNKIFKNVGYRGGCLKREGVTPLPTMVTLWTAFMKFTLHGRDTFFPMPLSCGKIRFLIFPCFRQA